MTVPPMNGSLVGEMDHPAAVMSDAVLDALLVGVDAASRAKGRKAGVEGVEGNLWTGHQVLICKPDLCRPFGVVVGFAAAGLLLMERESRGRMPGC
ncbi:hypothetical protein HYALB_00011960 [Hymenoscyphus albidus]|uniref:Uncharacterized protein n=1 Tax=Hymenoscyphus albidus TaxID=595503 RepID=A0A9N9LJZ3_9HELO|nr:hypothetical protein HYALB_00011960 [Hymenoscyphus albidus]